MTMEPGYVSLREFARRHAPLTLRAVQKAIESGRVTSVLRKPDGTLCGIHLERGWAEWQRNTDQGEAAKSGKFYPTPACSVQASTPGIDNAPAASLLGQVGQGGHALPAGSAVSPSVLDEQAPPIATENPVNGMTATPAGVQAQAQANRNQAGRGSTAGQIDVAVSGGLPFSEPAVPVGGIAGAPLQQGASPPAAPDEPGAQEPGFNESRAKRERFLAENAELDYLAKIGALVSVAEVEREVEEIFAAVKGNMFRMIPKKSAILAAETDPARIERLLTDALTQAFNESSRALADSPAGGAEERAAALP